MKTFILKNWMVVVVALAVVVMAGPFAAEYVLAMQTNYACPACESRNTESKVLPEFYEGKLMSWARYTTCRDCGSKSVTNAAPPPNAEEVAQARLAELATRR